MKTDAEIRVQGMQALINVLGLIETERFLVAVSREKFNYTEWRRDGLPRMTLEELAAIANKQSEQLGTKSAIG
ncbi:MAG: hypothetical protein ACRERU_04145 [Methylococcales bacterium]